MEINFKEIEFQLDFFKTGKATSFQSSVAKFSHNLKNGKIELYGELNFQKIEFQNKNTMSNSLKIEINCCIV